MNPSARHLERSSRCSGNDNCLLFSLLFLVPGQRHVLPARDSETWGWDLHSSSGGRQAEGGCFRKRSCLSVSKELWKVMAGLGDDSQASML